MPIIHGLFKTSFCNACSKSSSWCAYCYGQPIIAPGDGEVILYNVSANSVSGVLYVLRIQCIMEAHMSR